jgi:hypothetical protein
VLTSQVRSFWKFASSTAILPLGLATGPVMASGVVALGWQAARHRALAFGSASMTGMSLLVPLVTWLILTRGWRTAYVSSRDVLVAILPVALWVIAVAGADGAHAGWCRSTRRPPLRRVGG